jgi:hypothetical protein
MRIAGTVTIGDNRLSSGPLLIAIGSSARRLVVQKELIKAVRKLFEEGLRARLPDFVPYKMVDDGRNCHGSECRWYRWQVAPDLSFFVMLKPRTKVGDEFWIFVGWSRTEDHSDVTDNFEQCFNLGKLWNAPAGWYTWRLNEPGAIRAQTRHHKAWCAPGRSPEPLATTERRA